MKIAVLGGSGMLGSMLVSYLSQHYQVVATVRNAEYMRELPNVEWLEYDLCEIPVLPKVWDCGCIINAIGAIPQCGRDKYWLPNVIFPHLLAVYRRCNTKVIQICTDCVFDGRNGNYYENCLPFPGDVYGESKLTGESNSAIRLRCSIIGHGPHDDYSLLGWFLSQPEGAVVNGYTNHQWNGLTTLAFAKLCKVIIETGAANSLQHLVPADSVSKYELLCYFRDYFRPDITVRPVEAPQCVNRTLDTLYHNEMGYLWAEAGYSEAPTVEQMVKELGEWLNQTPIICI